MASNGYPQQGEGASPATTTSQPSGNTQPPDQVGWYFVEQYYTILGKNPDQVSLFYNKRSSLVWGTEGEVQPMVQGRPEISERIKSLNFKDCKVRVTNVDSQASAAGGILIQVMGEMINGQGPCRRFSQTFFLAEQPNGYYVLNDIFRYLKEEEEEEEEVLLEENAEEEILPGDEEAVVEPEAAPVEETPVEEPVKEGEDNSVPADTEPEPEPAKPEEPISIAPAVPEISTAVPTIEETNGTPVVEEAEPELVAEEPEVAPEPAEEEEAVPSPAPKAESAAVTPTQPTPVATPPPQQPVVEKPVTPAPAPAPAKPATWASLLGQPKPAVPVASPTPTAQTTQAPPVSQPSGQPPQSNTSATVTTPTSASSGQGWQNVSDVSRRHARPMSVTGAGDLQTQAYIKNVTENVNVDSLKDVLTKFGAIKSFEVIKARNCAFVEFETAAGFKAAKNASPLRIDDQIIHVEERRAQPARINGPGGYNPRSPATSQRGSDRQGQGRGGFQRVEGRFEGRDPRDGGRGGARGGSGRAFSSRGKGGATATN